LPKISVPFVSPAISSSIVSFHYSMKGESMWWSNTAN